MANQTARFISSYQGSATYEIPHSYDQYGLPETVEVRTHAYDLNSFKADVFAREIIPAVGTIKRYHGADMWPSPAACAMFPEYVPARWNPDTNEIEYRDGQRPDVTRDRFGVSVALIRAQAV